MNEMIGRKAKLIKTYPGFNDERHREHIATILSENGENYRIIIDGDILNLPKNFFEVIEEFQPKLVLSLIHETDSNTLARI